MTTNFFGKIVYGPQPKNFNNPNNAVIDGVLGSSKLSIKPIYANDNVSILYYEYTLHVEAIIDKDDNSSTGSLDAEDEARRLETILSKPGLKLMIYPVGLGTVPIINGTPADLSDDSSGNEYSPSHQIFNDVSGGPFPQNVSVAPFASNRAIYLRWEVMFRIIHCDFYPVNNDKAIELTIETDFDVDEEGDVRFTILGLYRQATPMSEGSIPRDLNNLLNFRLWILGSIDIDANGAFTFNHPWDGFNHKSKTSFSRDRRSLTFTITLDPIKSPNAYYAPAHSISAEDNLSSGLDVGFYKWTRTISATITLRKNYRKIVAWLIFLRILQHRLRYISLVQDIRLARDFVVVGQDAGNEDRSRRYILYSISVTDNIYSRQMRFSATFLILSSLRKILPVSNIFGRVHNSFETNPGNRTGTGNIRQHFHQPSPTKDQWARWSLESLYTPFGSTQPNLIRAVFDPCGTTSVIRPHMITEMEFDDTVPVSELPNQSTDPCAAENSGGDSAYYGFSGQQLSVDQGRNAEPLLGINKPLCSTFGDHQRTYPPNFEDSWLDYQASIEVIEDSNTIPIRYLSSFPITNYSASNSGPGLKAYYAMTIHNRSSPFDHKLPGPEFSLDNQSPETFHTISRGAPRFYIRFKGHAVRFMYHIPMPSLVAFNISSSADPSEPTNYPSYSPSSSSENLYKPLIRVGNPRFTHKQIGSSTHPVYVAKWDILYTIDESLQRGNILNRITATTDNSIIMS